MTSHRHLVASLVCFLLLVCRVYSQCNFPSITTTGAWVGSIGTMRACFAAIPLNSQTKSTTMTAVSNIAEIYSFTDLAANSHLNGASYSLSVNLRNGLAQVNAQTFATDYDFQMTLAALFRSLYDAHTTYSAPKSYQNSYVIFPFRIKSAVIGGQQRIVIADRVYTTNLYEDVFGRSIQQHVGKTVATIDGEDAFQAVKKFADEIPNSKDPAGRFNRALQSDFSQRVCSRFRIPSSNTFTITFTDGTSDSLPWMGIILRSYSGSSDWSNDMLTASVESSAAFDESTPVIASTEDPEQLKRDNIVRNIGRMLKPGEKLMPETMNSVALASFIEKQPKLTLKYKALLEAKKKDDQMFAHSVQLPVERSDNKAIIRSSLASNSLLELKKATTQQDTFYLLYNNAVPIIKLTTFSPNDGSTVPWQSSINVIREAIADSSSKGYENLIIDLSGNGGGYVCLSFGFIRAIVSDFARKARAYERYDLRRSDVADALINAGYMANSAWADASNYNTSNVELSAFTDRSWYNGPSYVRGGFTSQYSKKNFMNCDTQGNGRFWFGTPNNYFFKKIIIVTDGLCGSACSLFATKLRYYSKAVIVTMGGFRGEQMESSTFAGGAVHEYNNIVARAKAIGVNMNYPRTNLAVRVNWFEMYMGSQSLPREWIRVPGDFKLDSWEFADLESIYGAVVPVFAQIPAITNQYPYEPDVAAAGTLSFSAMMVLTSAIVALMLSFL